MGLAGGEEAEAHGRECSSGLDSAVALDYPPPVEILTGSQMREADRRAIGGMGIPGILLMENAGRAVADALLDDYPEATRVGVAVVCGKGNNGGDGFVAARRLLERGVAAHVVVLASTADLKGDAATACESARDSGVVVHEAPDAAGWVRQRDRVLARGIVLDAMLGTGVTGGARGLVAKGIDDLARAGARIVSIDLPSGVDADSGAVEGPAVRAERTYTLARPKAGLVLGDAAALAGAWRVLDIGIPDEAIGSTDLEWLDAVAVRSLVPRRALESHKGTYGHLLVVAGSRGKPGAAVLCARGALRSGVGLVTVATGREAQPLVAVQQAEVMTEAASSAPAALKLLATRDALAIGPGLGTTAAARALVEGTLKGRKVPAVLDADGLNAFAKEKKKALRLRAGRHPLVITPHPGEAGRLLGCSAAEIQADRPGAARRLAAATGAVVVLKGHRTVVADPGGALSFNASGNPGMASGGTGDVLTGAIGAFLSRGLGARDAARLGVFAHGDAGDRAAEVRGQEGMIATDLLEALPEALRALAGKA